MANVQLVNHAQFFDEQDLLVTAGIRGVFVFDFKYRGKYEPKLAALIDPKGRYIEIDLLNERMIENNQKWMKGLSLDTKNKIIISWNHSFVTFNDITPTSARATLEKSKSKLIDDSKPSPPY